MSRRKRKTLSIQEIERLSTLAKIELSRAEKARLAKELERILSHFSILERADVEDLLPMYHAMDLKNVFREDFPVEPKPEAALSNVPLRKGGYVQAPRIL